MMPVELVVPYWWSRLKYGVVLSKAVTEKIFACTGKTLRTSVLAAESNGKYGLLCGRILPGECLAGEVWLLVNMWLLAQPFSRSRYRYLLFPRVWGPRSTSKRWYY